VKKVYTDSILLIERLHRRFLDVIKTELDRLKIEDINNVQTLILYNIGDSQLTISELTVRGYYLGSNVSYNIKKLVESEYLIQEQSPHDKRSSKVRLAPKGLELCQRIDALYEHNVKELQDHGLVEAQLSQANEMLKKLEKYWTHYIERLYQPVF
jgi:DNA-binding MarR family transcriptional regulator